MMRLLLQVLFLPTVLSANPGQSRAPSPISHHLNTQTSLSSSYLPQQQGGGVREVFPPGQEKKRQIKRSQCTHALRCVLGQTPQTPQTHHDCARVKHTQA